MTASSVQRESGGRTYRLWCGLPALAAEIAAGLRTHGWEVGEDAPLGLLLDGPWGVALQGLAQCDPSSLIVVTDNPCPEYWEDLWDRRPRALLVGGHGIADLAESLRRASTGEFFRRTPKHDSPLTEVERHLLRMCAGGCETEEMAEDLDLTKGTVRNILSRVFDKLGFQNRVQATLYYWGLWHLLGESPLRPHVL